MLVSCSDRYGLAGRIANESDATEARPGWTDYTWGRATRRRRIGKRPDLPKADPGAPRRPSRNFRNAGNSIQLVLFGSGKLLGLLLCPSADSVPTLPICEVT